MLETTKPMLLCWAMIALAAFSACTPSTPAHASDEPALTCDNACALHTCDQSGHCTKWLCSDEKGCVASGSFQKGMTASSTTQPDTPNGRNSKGPAAIQPDSSSVQYVKLCAQGERCALYRLSPAGSELIGHFDDVDAEVKRLQSR